MFSAPKKKPLSSLEQSVMDYVWSHRDCTAEQVREALAAAKPLKESTVRTLLRRLEEKGYVTHEVEGRTYLYRAAEGRQNVAAEAVRGILDRFCGGSVEQLLVGLVDNDVVGPEELEQLARKIALKKEGR
jgi:predicted transcriptional regulator